MFFGPNLGENKKENLKGLVGSTDNDAINL